MVEWVEKDRLRTELKLMLCIGGSIPRLKLIQRKLEEGETNG